MPEVSPDINPILPVIIGHLDEPIDLERVVPGDELFKSTFYRKTFEAQGITWVCRWRGRPKASR